MYKQRTVSLCLPCRNEAGHLAEVVKRVPKIVDEIIVISNRSTDATLAVAERLGCQAIADDRTLDGIGYGYAHMTGIATANGDIIVGADGDATYPIEQLPAMIDYMLQRDIDFLSCNRYPLQRGTTIPWRLRAGVGLLNSEVRLLYGLKIQDILSGMWLFKRSVADDLDLTMGDWNLSPQIKLNAALNPNINFAEYSIAQHQRLGASHQNYFKTGLSHARWIARNRWQGRRQPSVALD